MDFATLYEDDTETWAELQVEALRRLAGRPGPWTNAIDWDNVIEEIEDLGSERRHAVESLLENAFAHALKVLADPTSLSARRWRDEINGFLVQQRALIKPSMRHRIGLDEVWRKACRNASIALEGYDRTMPEVPAVCPFAFDDALDPAFDPVSALERTSRRRRPMP